jgi:Arylsulfotransferase (ASST).
MCYQAKAQMHPAEGDTLNYRLIGFSIPDNEPSAKYVLELADGYYNNKVDFAKHIVLTQSANSNKQIATVANWGKVYTWRISKANNKDKIKSYGNLQHFVTGSRYIADTSLHKLQVVNADQHHKDLYVFLDYSKAMYDTKGDVLWYLPDIPGIVDRHSNIRDLKPTSNGTLTFIYSRGIYEIDYDGNVIWQKQNNPVSKEDMIETYHHDFTKLDNGHYMVCGNELLTMPLDVDTAELNGLHIPMMKMVNGKANRRLSLGTIVELDENGKHVWEWKCSEHMMDDTVFLHKIPRSPNELNPHMNSFYFDQKNNFVYISFKNPHHIIKVSYPSGKVVAKYNGAAYTPSLFLGQHAVRLNSNGDMILFNNNHKAFNSRNSEHTSYLGVYKELPDGKLQKQWDYSCNIDTLADPSCGAGGSMVELPDGCYMGCVGAAGRVFIASPDKKLIWNAVMMANDNGIWKTQEEYRASFVEKEALNKMIFNTK